MAKCERREIRPEPPPVEFVLTLTTEEASKLRATLGAAVYHQHLESICFALAKAGVP